VLGIGWIKAAKSRTRPVTRGGVFREESVHRPEWKSENQRGPPISSTQNPSDEELMRQLAEGREGLLGHSTVGTRRRSSTWPFIPSIATPPKRSCRMFPCRCGATRRYLLPARGAFRAWVMQIAHYRILNELRWRSHRPQLGRDPPTVRCYRASPTARRSRQMWVGAGFFARRFGIPLGTAETRIRSSLQRLREDSRL
jgi:hypothetical protein